jgi:HD superfamily phosphohydrolase YqeK
MVFPKTRRTSSPAKHGKTTAHFALPRYNIVELVSLHAVKCHGFPQNAANKFAG